MESIQSKLQEFSGLSGKASPAGNAACPEYVALFKSSEALCSAFAMLLQALQPLGVSMCSAWQEVVEEALMKQKARLQDLAAEDPRNWNEEEAERQLFEFTGLSRDLDRLQQQQRQQQAAAAQLRRRKHLSSAAAVQRDLHRALAEALTQVVEMDTACCVVHAPSAGETVEAPPIPSDEEAPSPSDLMDMGGDSPPVTLPHIPDDLLDLSGPNLIDVSEPTDSVAATAAPAVPSPVGEAPEDRATVDAVERWREGKNLRALLASVHLVAPNTAWTARSLSGLLDQAALKSAYREALLTFHPDKFPDQPILGRCVVDALIQAQRSER